MATAHPAADSGLEASPARTPARAGAGAGPAAFRARAAGAKRTGRASARRLLCSLGALNVVGGGPEKTHTVTRLRPDLSPLGTCQRPSRK